MTTTVLTTALIGALAFLPTASAQTDFAGTWVLDTTRSEGLPPGMGQSIMTLKQAGDRIEVDLQLQTPMGEQRIQDVYVLDGRETDFRPPVVGADSARGKRTSRWLQGRAGFEATESATLQGPEGEVTFTATRRWTLASGGDTLTMEMTVSGPQGEMKSTRVFTRQKPAAG